MVGGAGGEFAVVSTVKEYLAQGRGGAEEVQAKCDENRIGTVVVESAIEVHRVLGCGLLESVYERALELELVERGLDVKAQVPVDVAYKGKDLDLGFRADLLVEGIVLLELKSVETVTMAHRKQIQTYLNLTGYRLGYLLNFGAPLMKRGIIRCANGLPE